MGFFPQALPYCTENANGVVLYDVAKEKYGFRSVPNNQFNSYVSCITLLSVDIKSEIPKKAYFLEKQELLKKDLAYIYAHYTYSLAQEDFENP